MKHGSHGRPCQHPRLAFVLGSNGTLSRGAALPELQGQWRTSGSPGLPVLDNYDPAWQ